MIGKNLFIVTGLLTFSIFALSNIQGVYAQNIQQSGWDFVQADTSFSAPKTKSDSSRHVYKVNDIDKGALDVVAPFKGFSDDIMFSFSSRTDYQDSVDVKVLLRELSRKSGKNIVIDDSVSGTIDCKVENISLNEAMDLILSAAELEAKILGNTVFVATKSSMIRKGLNRRMVKSFKLNHAKALDVTTILEASIFNKGLEISTTVEETSGVSESERGLDMPLGMQSIPVSPDEGILNTSQPSISPSDTSSSTSGTSAQESGSVTSEVLRRVRVVENAIDAPSGYNSATTLASDITIKGESPRNGFYDVNNNSGGPIVIPDTRTNTILVLGDESDIELAEKAIKQIDKPLKQVFIEVSLIEMARTNALEWGLALSSSSGSFASGFNTGRDASTPRPIPQRDDPFNDGLEGIGLATAIGDAAIELVSVRKFSKEVAAQLRGQAGINNIKMIANPNVIVLDGREALVRLTNQIVNRITVTQTQQSVTESIDLADIGVVLNVLPRITDDGYITMRIRPSVTSNGGTYTSALTGSTINFVQTREVIIQDVRVKSGETLALAGLVREEDVKQETKVPILGDLPLVGNLFRTVNNRKAKVELVILLTPRIIDDIATTGQAVANISMRPKY